MSVRDTKTLVDVFLKRVEERPCFEAFHYIEKAGKSPQSISYNDLFQRSYQLSKDIEALNRDHKPVMLIFDCNIDYLVGFFACLLSGAVAVPVYPPTQSKHFDRLNAITKDCESHLFLTSEAILNMMRIVEPAKLQLLPAKHLQTDNSYDPSKKVKLSEIQLPDIQSEDIAFLQYTSGSTGTPKGVMLSHRSLLANMKASGRHYNFVKEDRLVMWLPLYHDLGLIGGLLSTLYHDCTLYFMAPMTVVRPYHWLKVMSDYKATLTAAPNFSYDMCVQKIKEEKIDGLDLSHLRHILSGAEPVREKTIVEFVDKFSRAGITVDQFTPSYGLAESCVFVSSRALSKKLSISSPKGSERTYVSSGVMNDELMIINSEGEKCLAGEEGCLYISGDSLFSGYWKHKNNEDLFEDIHGVKAFNTKDLAFYDENGDFYICGRAKDLIIHNGKNYYPDDIEISIKQNVENLAAEVNACFNIDNGNKEGIVVIQELSVNYEEEQIEKIYRDIKKNISSFFGLPVLEIKFVVKGQIKRTSAGKIRRFLTKQLYVSNELKAYKQYTLQDAFNKTIRRFKIKTVQLVTESSLISKFLLAGAGKQRNTRRSIPNS